MIGATTGFEITMVQARCTWYNIMWSNLSV